MKKIFQIFLAFYFVVGFAQNRPDNNFVKENFREEVNNIARIMANMPTKALGLTKRLLNKSLLNSLDEQLNLESKLQIESAQSEDYAEGVDAFVNKRKPNFIGK